MQCFIFAYFIDVLFKFILNNFKEKLQYQIIFLFLFGNF